MYQDIAAFRKNPGEVISMFSEALRIMDRNTTKYMIDSMEQELEDLRQEKDRLTQTNADLTQTNADLERTHAVLTQENADLTRQLAAYRERFGSI